MEEKTYGKLTFEELTFEFISKGLDPHLLIPVQRHEIIYDETIADTINEMWDIIQFLDYLDDDLIFIALERHCKTFAGALVVYGILKKKLTVDDIIAVLKHWFLFHQSEEAKREILETIPTTKMLRNGSTMMVLDVFVRFITGSFTDLIIEFN